MNKLISNQLFKAGAVLAVFSLASRAVGLFRDRILASEFGASRTLDVYYSAFKLPDLIFNLIVLGAVSSAFIPIFVDYYRSDEFKAWRLSQNFLSLIFSGVVVAAGLMFVFARPLSALIAPGFSGQDRELVISLTRLMLLSPVIFSLSTVMGSILQSLERFWAYAMAPVFYNLGIIIGAIYFAPFMAGHGQPAVFGLGLGVVLGALLHLLVQFPSALRAGFRFKLILSFADAGMKKIFKLMLPRTMGLGAYSIDSVVTNAIASTMAAGSITVVNFANNLQFVPISVVGISVATAVFPSLSYHASGNEKREFYEKLKNSLRKTFWLVLAVVVFIAIFSKPIISILFGVGLFRGMSIDLTASVLKIFMLGVIAQSLIPILSRAFYALQNTKTPVIISIISILINIGLALTFSFVFGWGVRGLALAFAIAGNVNFILLYVMFNRFFRR